MDLQEMLASDEQYQQLCLEYTLRNQRFLEIVLTLPPQQRTEALDLIDTVGKMFGRILEIASEA